MNRFLDTIYPLTSECFQHSQQAARENPPLNINVQVTPITTPYFVAYQAMYSKSITGQADHLCTETGNREDKGGVDKIVVQKRPVR